MSAAAAATAAATTAVSIATTNNPTSTTATNNSNNINNNNVNIESDNANPKMNIKDDSKTLQKRVRATITADSGSDDECLHLSGKDRWPCPPVAFPYAINRAGRHYEANLAHFIGKGCKYERYLDHISDPDIFIRNIDPRRENLKVCVDFCPIEFPNEDKETRDKLTHALRVAFGASGIEISRLGWDKQRHRIRIGCNRARHYESKAVKRRRLVTMPTLKEECCPFRFTVVFDTLTRRFHMRGGNGIKDHCNHPEPANESVVKVPPLHTAGLYATNANPPAPPIMPWSTSHATTAPAFPVFAANSTLGNAAAAIVAATNARENERKNALTNNNNQAPATAAASTTTTTTITTAQNNTIIANSDNDVDSKWGIIGPHRDACYSLMPLFRDVFGAANDSPDSYFAARQVLIESKEILQQRLAQIQEDKADPKKPKLKRTKLGEAEAGTIIT